MLILELRPLFNVDESVDDWLSWPKPSISSTDEDKTLVDVNHAIFTTKLYIIAKSKVASHILCTTKITQSYFSTYSFYYKNFTCSHWVHTPPIASEHRGPT